MGIVENDLKYYEKIKPRLMYMIIPILWFIIDYKGTGLAIYLDKLIGNEKMFLMMLLPSTICIILIGVIFKEDLIPKVLEQLKEPKTYLFAFVGAIIYVVSIIVYGIIQMSLSSGPVVSANEQILQDMATKVSPIVYFISIAILAPVLEELVFRYGLINLLDVRKKGFRWVPYVVSMVIFALLHEMALVTSPDMEHFLSFLGYCVISFAIVVTYAISGRRLASTIILHICINTFSTIMTL